MTHWFCIRPEIAWLSTRATHGPVANPWHPSVPVTTPRSSGSSNELTRTPHSYEKSLQQTHSKPYKVLTCSCLEKKRDSFNGRVTLKHHCCQRTAEELPGYSEGCVSSSHLSFEEHRLVWEQRVRVATGAHSHSVTPHSVTTQQQHRVFVYLHRNETPKMCSHWEVSSFSFSEVAPLC